jgi:hypothetical protein
VISSVSQQWISGCLQEWTRPWKGPHLCTVPPQGYYKYNFLHVLVLAVDALQKFSKPHNVNAHISFSIISHHWRKNWDKMWQCNSFCSEFHNNVPTFLEICFWTSYFN